MLVGDGYLTSNYKSSWAATQNASSIWALLFAGLIVSSKVAISKLTQSRNNAELFI